MSTYQYDNVLQRISKLLEGIQSDIKDVKREAQGIKEELRKKRENSELNQLIFYFSCYLVGLLSMFVMFVLFLKK
jgi:hypothetical protein